MNPNANEPLIRCTRPFADALTQTLGDPSRRALLLAQALAAQTGTPLAVCLLQSPGHLCASAIDATGTHRPEWTMALQKELGHWLAQGEASETRLEELPVQLNLAGHSLYVVRLACRDRCYGALAFADAPSREAAGATLVWAAAAVGALLRLEEADSAPPAHSMVVADLTRVVAHEFNNILNNITLQLAVMEQKNLSSDLQPDLVVIRQAARNAAGMINQLQQFSQRNQPPLEAVDLNALVHRVAARDRRPVTVALNLAPSLPRVQAVGSDLERMLEYLLEGSVAALAPEAGTITLQTEASPDRVRLRLMDTGPQVSAENLRRFFQPFAMLRRGSDGIAPALCKAVVRRFQGTIHAENQVEGGMAITLELRPAPRRDPPGAAG